MNNLALILFIALSISANASLNHKTDAPLINHMIEVNKNWLSQSIPLDQTISFQTEADRIQMHLLLVIQFLKTKDNTHLNSKQIQNRSDALDHLLKYANAKVFPQNTDHAYRIPYFIDNVNTACAVGEMLRTTDHEHIGQWVRENMNNAYVADIPEGELDNWAKKYGFSREELAWIQPGYPPSLQGWSGLAQGINGPAKTLIEYQGKLIIAGDFSEASGIEANNVVAWNGSSFEALENGINGWVNCSIIYQGKLYLGGSFNAGFADIAIWDGDSWSYEAAFASKYSETHSFGIYLDKLYAGGMASGFAGNDFLLAIWENPNWNWVAEFEGGQINVIEQYVDEMLVGGDFQSIIINGSFIEANNIAIFSNQGFWQEFNGGLDGYVNDIFINGSDVLVAGLIEDDQDFSFGLAKASNSSWTQIINEGAFTQNYSNNNTTGYFSKILIQEGDTLLAGEYSTSTLTVIGSCLSQLITSWGASTGNPLISTQGKVYDIKFFQNKLYIAGDFQQLTGTDFNNVAFFDSTIDVEEISDSEYSLFPNPVSDFLQINFNQNQRIEPLVMYDINGKSVSIKSSIDDAQINLQLDHLSAGTYMLFIKTEKGILSEKIIKD